MITLGANKEENHPRFLAFGLVLKEDSTGVECNGR